MEISKLRNYLLEGQAIPALPLALTEERAWSERHQRALLRYYHAAGAGGIAVAVHSTQFEIRLPEFSLFEPLLQLASEEAASLQRSQPRDFVMIAGLCGRTKQATQEAETARLLGYSAGLLSLGAYRDDSPAVILAHVETISRILPIIGFYLQPAVGGRVFPYSFWRKFFEIENIAAVKIAPFNRYQTIDVVRASIDAGRTDVALYTGNDDSIILDLLTRWEFAGQNRTISGGLLGQFGVWTRKAVELLAEIKQARTQTGLTAEWLTRNAQLTDANAAIFDAANSFHGCISGINEVLRRVGLLPSSKCLRKDEVLSPGQAEEITRVSTEYPWLIDDAFVRENLSTWLER